MADDRQTLSDEEVKQPAPKVIPAVVNKWAGEDEEDDIKDSWDADDDDEKKDVGKNDSPAPSKPKKTLQQKIAEKEKLRLEQEEKRRKEKEEEDMAHMTPEERAAEKKRLQLLQEEADTKMGLDTLGLTAFAADSANPTSKEDLEEFAKVISRHVSQHKDNPEYVPFVEELVKKLCAGLSSTNIKRVKTPLEALYTEKQKMEKGDKPKKKSKAKVTLRMEGDDDYSSRAGAYEADDYDDFM